MAIRGSLREASLPDVLQLLALGQKTGCLSVSDRSNFGSIYLDRGRVTYAMILNRPDRLGDVLLRHEKVTAAQLTAAVERQERQPNTRLGQILVDQGVIQQQDLEQYVRMQIEDAIYSLFTWSQGSFYFEADEVPEDGVFRVSMNAESLLLEGARRVDEWSLIEKKISSFDLIFGPDPASVPDAEAELTDEQRTVLPLLDGVRSVRDVVEDAGLGEFDVGKAIYGMLQAGFVRPAGRRVAEAAPSRAGEHRNLGLAFYRTEMWDEAVREWMHVAELDQESREPAFYLGLINLRRGDPAGSVRHFRRAIAGEGARPAVLANVALALEHMGRLEDARLAVEQGLKLFPRHPRLLLSRAIVLLKLRRLAEARESFTRYREAVGERGRPALTYFVFGVLAEAASGDLDAALRIGEEGLALYPDAAPLLLHAGAVWERRGEVEAAETFYRRALDEDPEFAQAHKALADLRYGRGALDEATDGYRRAIGLDPDLGGDAYFKLGNIHYQRMERPEAIRLWRRALELDPQNDAARLNLELVQRASP